MASMDLGALGAGAEEAGLLGISADIRADHIRHERLSVSESGCLQHESDV